MNAVFIFKLFLAKKETAAARFKTGESLCLQQFDR